MSKGLRVPRRFTTEGADPYVSIEWAKRDSRITNPDGSVVFEVKDAEVPASWSQVATDIIVSKYFRKAGVPQTDESGNSVLGSETSARQVFDRLAGTWRWWGEKHGYFASVIDAQAFEDEMKFMLANQIASPNSPQWFNTGLAHAYGITGTPQGFWYVDPETKQLTSSPDAYTHPAPHACFPPTARIAAEDGFKAIEKIEPGDRVLTHLGRYRTVLQTMQRQVEEELVSLRIANLSATPFVSTANHPVLALRRTEVGSGQLDPQWLPAGDLETGDYVVISRPTDSHVISAPTDIAAFASPNFEVSDTHLTTRDSVTVSVKDASELAERCAVEVPLSPIQSRFLRIGEDRAYRIQSTTRVPFFGTVYNFQVEEDESYVADGVVVHNCFINTVNDDLVNPGGIMDLWVREARLFKMGSGTGSNFSKIRAENEMLSGGGKSSGVMGFLRIGDRAAGAIKSGGTTRRAAKMVILDLDHPDVEEFIDWKKHEEDKARVLIQHGGYPADFNGEAYSTVSGQNSNNSVRVPNEFIEAVRNDGDWELRERTSGKVRKTVKARDLWRKVAEAAWACADPGVQFDTIINEWHTSPAGGKIRATNPCAEYVFLDDTACNLASINLIRFYDDQSRHFDTEAYEHVIRLWTIALEISVTMAHFPSKEIAQGSYDYRTLGLGYANLGTLLMRMGLPYDSDAGRSVSGAITSVLTGYAYATSAELAASVGPFERFHENREAMLRVVRNHRRAAYDSAQREYEGLSHHVMGIDAHLISPNLLTAARQSWDLALDMGERHGFRNAQVTVIAPTGCLVGDSLVPTELGLTRLYSLGDGRGGQWQELGIKVGTDQGAKTAAQFYVNGVEPVVTVSTSRGYRIQGTPTHRIKVVGPDGGWVWKRLGEIQKTDLVPLQLGQLVGGPRVIRLSDIGQVTSDVAELIGVVVGFGNVDGETLHIGGSNPTEVGLLLKRIFGEDVSTTQGDGVTVSLTAKPRLRALAAFAGSGQVPDEILASNSSEIYRAFASQLFGVAIDEGLARDLQSLELAIGQPSRLSGSTSGWRVILDASFTRAAYIFDEVVAAGLGDERWTFDLSVPENLTYVANGFVSHNTIGLQMDCDTTGVEPDFALVKFKKLAGGGYFKIVNQSVAPALCNLGYQEEQIEEIVRYIVGTSSLEGASHINSESLTEKGFTEEDLTAIERALPAVFELKHAFNPFVLGEPAMLRLGFEPHEYATFEFDLLRSLGFSGREIREATEWVCGQQTIEGAPHLKDEHLAVFDTANRNGRNGTRLIHHTGHIRMLAATQPFLSGAASKTINMPNEATVEDIEESYMLSYELGVKCMALYRDGSKASQPLSAGSDDAQPEDEPEAVTLAHELDKQILWGKIPVGMSPTQAYSQGMHPPRFVLPSRRGGYTQEARIGGHKVYLRTGEYDDGTLGEVFIDLAKEGATLRGILSCFAIAVSKGLQFGVPLEEFVDTFTFQTFEPRGLVEGHPNIKMANSIVDYVFRALAVEYLHRDELAQVPPNRDGDLPEPKKGLALDAGVQLDLTDAVAEEDVTAVASAVTFLGQGPVATKPAPVVRVAAASAPDAGTRAMQSALGEMMGDAPLCDTCGHITIRNGSCYKCLNCGNSLGCS